MSRTSRLTIGRRFNGPAPSGNGGYTCGLLASVAGLAEPVTVRLLRPPPLEEPLEVVPAGEGAVELRGEGGPVATAVAGSVSWSEIPPVGLEEAAAAEREYAGHRSHPFPGCFVCGTAREPGDGLRLFPGPVGGGLVAAAWTPHPSLADDPGGRLPAAVTWAALDCPSAWTTDLEARPLVLGEMTAQVELPPVAGTPYVVVARHRGTEGRKVRTAAALFDADGRRLARAEHVWLAIGPELLAELQRG